MLKVVSFNVVHSKGEMNCQFEEENTLVEKMAF